MADLLNIGLSGLSASKSQLSVTGHNISNVNTPGFSRQDASQATRTPQFSGAGYVGSGTTLVEIRRSYSEFLTSQLRSSTSLSSDVEAYKSQIDQLDSLLAGSTTGITPALQKFFSALQTAAEDPANIPARQLVLAEAEGLARRFNTVSDRLTEQNNFTNKQMAAVTDQVNRLAGSIGSLNDAIATASANGKQPNDLLDARDEAVRQLSTYIGISVTPQDDNSFNISVGSGQPLVVGKTVSQLKVVPGLSDPNRHEIRFVSGGSEQGITSQITGGELGGLIRYRSEVLDSTMNSLGRLALVVSDEVNTQLGQGLDLKGQVGVGLFKDINSSDLVGRRTYPTGLDVRIETPSSLTTSDYQIEFVSGSTEQFRVRPVGGAWLQTSGVPTVFDVSNGEIAGLGFSVGPASVAGATYTAMPTRRGATDIAVDLDQADQLAFASIVRGESSLQNRGTGNISQPLLLSGPSPIDVPGLKSAFAALPAFEATVANGTYTFNSSSTLPPEWQLIDSNGNPLSSLASGTTNTVRLAYTPPPVPPSTSSDPYLFEFSLSGRPQSGDAFSLGFNTNGVSDNRNALALVNLQTKQTVGVDSAIVGSGFSFTDGYGEMVERVGTLTAQARMDSEATGAILKQATDNRDSLSAVNLDEEAANLIKFEQYYNASAQIIQVARSLFDTLINTFR